MSWSKPGPFSFQECLWCKIFKQSTTSILELASSRFLLSDTSYSCSCWLRLFQTSEDWYLVMTMKVAWSWLWWIIWREQGSVCGPAPCSYNGFISAAHHQPLYNQPPHVLASTSTALINVASVFSVQIVHTVNFSQLQIGRTICSSPMKRYQRVSVHLLCKLW